MPPGTCDVTVSNAREECSRLGRKKVNAKKINPKPNHSPSLTVILTLM